jgi:3-keto-5-aminohexanoate cleavage enzyme
MMTMTMKQSIFSSKQIHQQNGIIKRYLSNIGKNKITVVTASLNGVLTDPKRFNVPVTPKEIGQAAYEAHEEGASIVHVHFRDQKQGALPSWDPSLAGDVAQEIRHRVPGLIVNFTTGTFGNDKTPFSGGELGPTLGPISCLEAGLPEMAALNCGSLNYLKATERGSWAWKPMLFDNPVEKVEAMLQAMNRLKIVPECETFDTGIVRSIAMYDKIGLFSQLNKINVSFVMGVASGMAANPDWLPLLIKELPAKAQWQVIAIGEAQNVWPLLARACELGGNVRTGLEDHFYLPDGTRAKSSGELVKALVKILKQTGREPATIQQAREIIGCRR